MNSWKRRRLDVEGINIVLTREADVKINSALLKLAKLQPATDVFRSVTNGLLPEIFWKANEFNVKGGVFYEHDDQSRGSSDLLRSQDEQREHYYSGPVGHD
jgi:hypothetical protein